MSVPEGTEDIDTMRRLWSHEILRVFGDRLIDDEDRQWLFDSICKIIDEKMERDPDDLFVRLRQPKQKVSWEKNCDYFKFFKVFWTHPEFLPNFLTNLM